MKKFKFDLISKPHIIAKRYCSSKDKLSLDNEEDMKNFRLVMEIDDLKKNARNKWIKNHQSELDFIYDGVVDTGTEWVDELNIYAKDNGEKLFSLHFGTTRDYENYMKKIRA